MGSGLGNAAADRQTVYEELTGALQELRGGVHAPDMARSLFRHARGSTDLVGLADGGERAVFYDARVVRAVPFDRHGLVFDGREQVWRGIGGPTAWVVGHSGLLAWVHPEYRWVLEER